MIKQPTISPTIAIAFAIGYLLAGCQQAEAPPQVPTPITRAPIAQPAAVIPPPPRPTPVYLRDHYASLTDCVHDWGYPQKCTPVAPKSGAAGQFTGPIYLRTYREETQARLRQEALENGYAQRVADESSDRSIAKSEVKS